MAHVAITIKSRLIVLPTIPSGCRPSLPAELQTSEDVCLDYAQVSIKRSADGKSLAVLYQSVIGQRSGNTIRTHGSRPGACKKWTPSSQMKSRAGSLLIKATKSFRSCHPIIGMATTVSCSTFIRNAVYGQLYVYDTATGSETIKSDQQRLLLSVGGLQPEWHISTAGLSG